MDQLDKIKFDAFRPLMVKDLIEGSVCDFIPKFKTLATILVLKGLSDKTPMLLIESIASLVNSLAMTATGGNRKGARYVIEGVHLTLGEVLKVMSADPNAAPDPSAHVEIITMPTSGSSFGKGGQS